MKKCLIIIVVLIFISAIYFSMFPQRRIVGGLRGGPIAPIEQVLVTKYSCFGIPYDYCPPWPDYGCDALCYGIVYGKKCYEQSYRVETLMAEIETHCVGLEISNLGL